MTFFFDEKMPYSHKADSLKRNTPAHCHRRIDRTRCDLAPLSSCQDARKTNARYLSQESLNTILNLNVYRLAECSFGL